MEDVAFVVRRSWRGHLMYSQEEDRWYLLMEYDDEAEFADDTAPAKPVDLRPCSKPHARRLLYFDGRQDLIEQYREALDPRRGDHRR
jgi:hypothetical protein